MKQFLRAEEFEIQEDSSRYYSGIRMELEKKYPRIPREFRT